jgi:alkanesulfonate monooxygenase SsuD/methylene tetrahydromethanopterin reductase-like flavin-dependent oxidoreductase (luciferase family)
VEKLGLALRDMTLGEMTEISVAAEECGLTHIFLPETGQLPRTPVDGRDPAIVAASIFARTTRIRVGPGIVGTVFRTARHTALSAATLQELSSGRFVLGVGVSHRSLAEPLGASFPDSPLAHARAYCDELRELSAGHLAFGRGFPIILAARGDRMIEVAVRHADGTMLTWSTPEDVARVRSLVAGVPQPAADVFENVVLVRVGPKESLLRDAGLYGGSLPGYAEHFRRQGLSSDDQVIAAACITLDSVSAMKDRLEEYRSAGATIPCIYPSGMAPSAVLGLLEAWRDA